MPFAADSADVSPAARGSAALFLWLALGVFASCSSGQNEQRASNIGQSAGSPPQGPFSPPQTNAADDGQWTMAAKDYANTRFSGLNEINTGNVGRMRVAWTFSTGVAAGHEAAPLVVGNTMYLVTPFPNFVYALDLAARVTTPRLRI